MEIGVCTGVEHAEITSLAGADYFEWSVGGYLQPLKDNAQFEAALEQVRKASIPCPAVNVLLPGDQKVTGPEVNLRALEDYTSVVFQRAHEAGIKVIVFGSGGARRVPDGFDYDKAEEQLVVFGQMLGKWAENEGVMVAVEPLNRLECNILNTLEEAANYVRKVNMPAFRLLVDSFHLDMEGESTDSIVKNADILVHAHIATKANRLPPGGEDHDFSPFFQALKDANYTGRLSIEARLPDPADSALYIRQIQSAINLLRSLAIG